MLRLFIATTQTNSLFAALHAKQTAAPDKTDILILDAVKKKESLINLIKESSSVYAWKDIIDFSIPVSDSLNLKPSLRKRIIRKLKTKFPVKYLYDILYKNELKNVNAQLLEKIKLKLKNYSDKNIELFLLTQTALNDALSKFYPIAKINYLEHGLGDYLYVQNKKNNFYCIFSEQFKKYLSLKGKDNSFVYSAFELSDFGITCDKLIKNKIISIPDKSVLILMENVEMYNVPVSFWSSYIDKCLEHIPDYKNYTYIIKPHHLQSFEAIELTKKHFKKLQLDFQFTDDKELMNTGIEFLFPIWKKNIHHVFALFSSSLFYLSVLYPEPTITYHYSTSFMEKYLESAPEQFKNHFYGLKELIEGVFSANCKSIS